MGGDEEWMTNTENEMCLARMQKFSTAMPQILAKTNEQTVPP